VVAKDSIDEIYLAELAPVCSRPPGRWDNTGTPL
jgi:hypothetical protein